MPGYNWREGKSNNAVIAVSEGKMPATRMAAWLRKRGRRYAGCSTKIVRECLAVCEWHHTSKFYNETEYFDPRDLLEGYIREHLAELCRNQRVNRKLIREHKRGGSDWLKTPDGEVWYPLSMVQILKSFETERLTASLEIVNSERKS